MWPVGEEDFHLEGQHGRFEGMQVMMGDGDVGQRCKCRTEVRRTGRYEEDDEYEFRSGDWRLKIGD